MSPEMTHALATAVSQWHEAQRRYETVSHAFADAQLQLQHAERDLHELARAIEVATGKPAELVTSAATPIGAVTMPVVPATGPTIGTPADGIDAGQVVLDHMMAQARMGMTP